MVQFFNDAELFQYLLDGGTITEKNGSNRREIRLVEGMRTYVKSIDTVKAGESAKNCILSYDWWVGKGR